MRGGRPAEPLDDGRGGFPGDAVDVGHGLVPCRCNLAFGCGQLSAEISLKRLAARFDAGVHFVALGLRDGLGAGARLGQGFLVGDAGGLGLRCLLYTSDAADE